MLPTISEIFDEIGKNKYFSAIDISQGFTNIPIKESDIYKTAWSLSNLGRFEYRVLPFGLMNAPRTFFRVISKALEGLIGVICFCCIDDIIIFSKDLKTHLKRLRIIFDRLRKANLKLQTAKCDFLKDRIKFLGHVLSENGLEMDEEKVAAIKNFPIPTNLKKVQSFLGVCNYYRRFINQFSKISYPLTELLQKNTTFKWNVERQGAFDLLKITLCKAPIL